MQSVTRVIDRALGWLKWPVAIAALLFLPALVLALRDVLRAILRSPRPLFPFFAGAGIYLLAWYLVLRRPTVGAFFSTLEHELTHAVFAWLTLHRVVGFHVTWRKGGHMQYLGEGNWLITIAPYFFPTLSVFVLVVLGFLPAHWVAWGSMALGATVAYHATSTWLETHGHQTDLQKVGFPFAWCFLPSANALMYGSLVSFASGGWRPLSLYFEHVGAHAADLAELIYSRV